MTLQETIAEAQRHIPNLACNAEGVYEHVVHPLMLSAGYDEQDSELIVDDRMGSIPGYILHAKASSLKWFLQVIDWNELIGHSHAGPALNGAGEHGMRFVVLTNGRNWQLYDNSALGATGARLVVSAALRDTKTFKSFLTAISKSQVCAGDLEQLAETALLERRKRFEWCDDDVEIIKNTEGRHYEFWKLVRHYYAALNPMVPARKVYMRGAWYKMTFGNKYAHYEWTIKKIRPVIEVAIHFETDDRQLNLTNMNKLISSCPHPGDNIEYPVEHFQRGAKKAIVQFAIPYTSDFVNDETAMKAARVMAVLIERTIKVLRGMNA